MTWAAFQWFLALLARLGRKWVLVAPDGYVWMERWLLVYKPTIRDWWGFFPTITVHHLTAADLEVPHTHGCATWTFPVRGGYREWVDGVERDVKARRFARLRGDQFHKLLSVQPDTWTIFYRGWKFRRVEFLVDGVPRDAREVMGKKKVRASWKRWTPELQRDIERRQAKAKALGVHRTSTI